jgi:RHS repeat-associated protein
MPGRYASSGDYRYGFNGMEHDDEVKTDLNSYDFGARMYDPRLGRWMSVDPQARIQPGWSPYKAFLDNPILFIDPEGETEYGVHITLSAKTGTWISTVSTISDKSKPVHTVITGPWTEQKTKDIHHVTVTFEGKNGKIKTYTYTEYVEKPESYDGLYGVPVWTDNPDGTGVLMGEGRFLPGGNSYDNTLAGPSSLGKGNNYFEFISFVVDGANTILNLFDGLLDDSTEETTDESKEVVSVPLNKNRVAFLDKESGDTVSVTTKAQGYSQPKNKDVKYKGSKAEGDNEPVEDGTP